MRKTLKWRLIILCGLALLLAGSTVACASIDRESYNYLSEMERWYDEWSEYESRFLWDYTNKAFDELVDELEAIETPRKPIPFEFSEGTSDYWTFADHLDCVDAYRHYLAATRHMETMQELEEKRYIRAWGGIRPSCDVALRYGEGSPEYKEACRIVSHAGERLGYYRYRLTLLWVLYLPERSE